MNTVTPGQRPTLVFIHGFLDGSAVWADVMAELGERAAGSISVDLAGMGARAGEPGPYSLDRFAQDVVQQARALGRPLVLIGQSMGAQVAELAAIQLGEQARGLVLLTPVPLQGTRLPDEAMQPFHALGGNPAMQRGLRRQLGTGLSDDRVELLGRLGDVVEAASVGQFAELWNQGHPLGGQATRFAGPVLLVRGENDPFVTAEVFTGAVLPRFDKATTSSIFKAGHWPHVEQPRAVAGVLRDFLASIDAPAVAPQGWTRAFEQKSSSAFADAFAEDIVLEASVMAKPVAGADKVKVVMGAASKIYEALAFTHQASEGPRTYLEWEAQAFGGEKFRGITILTKNDDGQVVRAAIHHRPLGSALKFSAELGRRLQGQIDSDHFFKEI